MTSTENSKKKREFTFGLTGGVKNLETHFSLMAEKGWMIEKLGVMFHRYKAVEPCIMRFYVDVLPEIGIFDYPHGRETLNYRRQCEEAGWSFVTAHREVNVFCTTKCADESPAPDPDNQSHCLAYMKAYRKAEMLSSIYAIIVLLFIVYIPFVRTGAALFLSDFSTFTLLGMPILVVGVLTHIVVGAAWYMRTWRASKQGLPPPVISPWLCKTIRNINLVGLIVFVVSVVIGLAFEARSGMFVQLLIFILLPLVGIGIGLTVRRRIDSEDRPRGENIASAIMATIGAGAIGMIVAIFAVGLLPFPSLEYSHQLERPALTFGALGLELSDDVFFREDRTSVAIPVNYVYTESKPSGEVFTRVRRASHGFIARSMYNHMVEDVLDWELLWEYERGLEFSYGRLNGADAEFWGADEGFWSMSELGGATFILLRDRVVLLFRTSIGIEVDQYVLGQAVRELWLDL